MDREGEELFIKLQLQTPPPSSPINKPETVLINIVEYSKIFFHQIWKWFRYFIPFFFCFILHSIRSEKANCQPERSVFFFFCFSREDNFSPISVCSLVSSIYLSIGLLFPFYYIFSFLCFVRFVDFRFVCKKTKF